MFYFSIINIVFSILLTILAYADDLTINNNEKAKEQSISDKQRLELIKYRNKLDIKKTESEVTKSINSKGLEQFVHNLEIESSNNEQVIELKQTNMASKDLWTKQEGFSESITNSWSNKVASEKGITLQEAKQIASENRNINYFFYIRQYEDGDVYVNLGKHGQFTSGDAVFFSGVPSPSICTVCDTYIKN